MYKFILYTFSSLGTGSIAFQLKYCLLRAFTSVNIIIIIITITIRIIRVSGDDKTVLMEIEKICVSVRVASILEPLIRHIILYYSNTYHTVLLLLLFFFFTLWSPLSPGVHPPSRFKTPGSPRLINHLGTRAFAALYYYIIYAVSLYSMLSVDQGEIFGWCP